MEVGDRPLLDWLIASLVDQAPVIVLGAAVLAFVLVVIRLARRH